MKNFGQGSPVCHVIFSERKELGMIVYIDFFLELPMVVKISMVPTSIDADLSNGDIFV